MATPSAGGAFLPYQDQAVKQGLAVTGNLSVAGTLSDPASTPTTNQITTYVSPLFGRVNGMQKFINRPTTDAFAVQVKTEFTGTATSHRAVDATADWKGNSTAGVNIALSGVARVKSTYTMGAGACQGLYGQVAIDGTVNSGSAFLNAIYGLIEDGGVYTAVGHLAAAWFDSHLTKTVTAGRTSFQYITNNGSTTFDQVFYVYGGNKISALFSLDTVSTMVGTGGTLGGTLKKITINIDGTPYYLIAGTTVS